MSRFLGYAWLPLIGALAWAAAIIALLVVWLVQGHPEYAPGEQTILYISDVAAGHGWQQAIFITGGAITAIAFTGSVIIDRWLRHRGRLPRVARRREKWASNLAIIAAILGSLALVILTCFNDQAFTHVHWTCTVLFVIFIALSAIFTTFEEAYLHQDYPSRKHLRRSTYAKFIIVTFEILAAIAFGALQTKNTDTYNSASAVLEWTIAIVFVFYLLTFVEDLRPAVKTSEGYLARHPEKVDLAEGQTAYQMTNEGVNGSDRLATSQPSAYQHGPHSGTTTEKASNPEHNPEHFTSDSGGVNQQATGNRYSTSSYDDGTRYNIQESHTGYAV